MTLTTLGTRRKARRRVCAGFVGAICALLAIACSSDDPDPSPSLPYGLPPLEGRHLDDLDRTLTACPNVYFELRPEPPSDVDRSAIIVLDVEILDGVGGTPAAAPPQRFLTSHEPSPTGSPDVTAPASSDVTPSPEPSPDPPAPSDDPQSQDPTATATPPTVGPAGDCPEVAATVVLHLGVEVPLLIGVAVADADRTTAPYGLSVRHVDAEGGGRIIQEQNPEAGVGVGFGSVVLVYTRGSSGGPGPEPEPEPAQKSVPDVTGAEDEDEACDLVEAAGFECQLDPPRPDGSPLGAVDRQVPRGGSQAPEGSTVTVFVRVIAVPNVVNRPEDEACDAIDDDLVCSIDPDNDRGVAPGIVTGQAPDPGTLVRPGSTVTISVHRQPRPAPVPSVQDLHVDDACRIIQEAGFTCDRQPWQGEGPDGRVMLQSPAAGEAAIPGEQPVTVFVARATPPTIWVVLGVVFGGLAVLVGVIGLPFWLRGRHRQP